MKNKYIYSIAIAAYFILFNVASLYSREVKNMPNPKLNLKNQKILAGCGTPASFIDLDINNVRARLLNGGDMWWDLTNAKYEVPKVIPGSGALIKTAFFTGAIWLGGIDDAGILRTAGQTYRQNGSPGLDFWPGPIDTTTGNIISEDCDLYDNHYKINRVDIENFRALGGTIPKAIAEWPGNPFKPYQFPKQAPFVDIDGNGIYNPTNGLPGKSDYPSIIGDQSIWWVINDVGNIHTQYDGQPIGIEIQNLAFAFNTQNEINDMTFYRYTLINRGSNTLNQTYLAQWADPDLGNANDDYVGVDVDRSLGYCVNGDDDDEGSTGYGINPPAVGIDFFEGPFSDFGDGVDNDRDGIIDEVDTLINGITQTERIALSKFIHFTNTSPEGQNDPMKDFEMYRYLTGFWEDGNQLTYGGTGYDPLGTVFSNYSFPGTTDPEGRPFWSECSEGNKPDDRRFVESAGPFTLTPGAINIITVGVVFARNVSGAAACPDGGALADLLLADDKAQALFDNNFQLADGPPTPPLKIVELDRRLIISIDNAQLTEEYNKVELDAGLNKSRYKFQGYKLYQVRNSSVSVVEVDNPANSALIYQADVKDGVGTIISKAFDPIVQNLQAKVEVVGADAGIKHTFEFTRDAFSNNDIISNNKQYFFLLVAYAYSPEAISTLPGKEYANQYLAGRIGVNISIGIPRISDPRFGGSSISETFSGVELKRLSGSGNGNNFVKFLNNDASEVISEGLINNPVYSINQGPVKISTYDPFKVPNADFEIKFGDTINIVENGILISSTFIPGLERWILINKTNNDTIFSDTTLIDYEQLIPKYGLFINTYNPNLPGSNINENNNGFIGASINYKDPSKNYLSFVIDNNTASDPNNWIDQIGGSASSIDPNSAYGSILGGTFAPYRFTSTSATKLTGVTPSFEFPFAELPSIDIIFTPDVTKWSKCIVVESGSSSSTNEENQAKYNLRKGKSIANTNFDTVTDGSLGRSYFPGYAINTSTGVRLNIFFAENSSDQTNNGRDMKFNPTSSRTSGSQGGKHFLYVSNTRYDECNELFTLLSPISSPSNTNRRNAYKTISWSAIPLANNLEFLSNEATISLRVSAPYNRFTTNNNDNLGFPYYSFNTKILAAVKGNNVVAKTALDLIRVVPNPYYGFSEYEQGKLDNRVKFTNLPTKCEITIYSTSGVYITRLEKDDVDRNFIDWNLQNDKKIPIASGMYIIHVNADGIGEKILKWFGVLRPTDLDNF